MLASIKAKEVAFVCRAAQRTRSVQHHVETVHLPDDGVARPQTCRKDSLTGRVLEGQEHTVLHRTSADRTEQPA